MVLAKKAQHPKKWFALSLLACVLPSTQSQAYSDDVVARAAISAYVPSLSAHYTLSDQGSHGFWISLSWDFDEVFAGERLVQAIEMQNLERDRLILMQQEGIRQCLNSTR